MEAAASGENPASAGEVDLNCPACQNPLIVFELERVEVDHCVSCGGVWLDGGELETLLEGASNKDDLMATLTRKIGRKEKKIRCPICARKMDRVLCGLEEEVHLDKCPKSHGLWFDAGELRDVLKMGNFPSEARVYRLLSDVFKSIGRP